MRCVANALRIIIEHVPIRNPVYDVLIERHFIDTFLMVCFFFRLKLCDGHQVFLEIEILKSINLSF